MVFRQTSEFIAIKVSEQSAVFLRKYVLFFNTVLSVSLLSKKIAFSDHCTTVKSFALSAEGSVGHREDLAAIQKIYDLLEL